MRLPFSEFGVVVGLEQQPQRELPEAALIMVNPRNVVSSQPAFKCADYDR